MAKMLGKYTHTYIHIQRMYWGVLDLILQRITFNHKMNLWFYINILLLNTFDISFLKFLCFPKISNGKLLRNVIFFFIVLRTFQHSSHTLIYIYIEREREKEREKMEINLLKYQYKIWKIKIVRGCIHIWIYAYLVLSYFIYVYILIYVNILGGSHGVRVIIVENKTRQLGFKSWMMLFTFHIMLIPLGKVCI